MLLNGSRHESTCGVKSLKNESGRWLPANLRCSSVSWNIGVWNAALSVESGDELAMCIGDGQENGMERAKGMNDDAGRTSINKPTLETLLQMQQ